ncbi:hypothetical protein ES705_16477 [subsurface metagenome]
MKTFVKSAKQKVTLSRDNSFVIIGVGSGINSGERICDYCVMPAAPYHNTILVTPAPLERLRRV